MGQSNKVTYVDLVSKGMMIEKIVKALRSKLNLAQKYWVMKNGEIGFA